MATSPSARSAGGTAIPAIGSSRTGRDRRVTLRHLPKVLAAWLVLLLFVFGFWGALSAVRATRDDRRADGLHSAYDRLRDAAGVERTAQSTPASAGEQGRRAFFAGARKAAAALEEAYASAGVADLPRIRRLTAIHTRSVERGARLFAALEHGRRSQAAELRRANDRALAALGREAERGASDLRLHAAAGWPSTSLDVLALVGMTLVFALGLGLTGTVLIRTAGYRYRRPDERQKELARLELAALTDNLTGLRNHRAFQEDLSREIERRNRTGIGFSLIAVDVDGLKQINDTQGHQAGDQRIRAVAECLQATVRGADCAYRVGGDEFMVLLPGERAWGALMYAHRLHAQGVRRRGSVPVTVGITESTGTESKDLLIGQADLALYEAKRTHLKTVVHGPGLEPHKTEADPDEHRHHQQVLATALARAVDARDAAMSNHCETVAELCVLVGRELGLDAERLQQLRIAGLLHDVGKIGIADAILQKPAQLAREERAIMGTHTTIGHNIVSTAELAEEAKWVLHHHERWDGQGYPGGLTGEEIPLESRIILVADAFEAITADRPYRSGRTPEEALGEIVAHAGTQFDPRCVAALCAVFGHVPLVPLAGELGELRTWRAGAREPLAEVTRTTA